MYSLLSEEGDLVFDSGVVTPGGTDEVNFKVEIPGS